VPYNYQRLLVGRLHKWLGENKIHDAVSLYSLSWLRGGQAGPDGLIFANGAECFMSFHDAGLAKQALAAALEDVEFFCGLAISEIALKPTPEFSTEARFLAASPVLVRDRTEAGRIRHYTFEDPEADAILTRTAKTRLRTAGLGDVSESIKVAFDRSYAGARTKLIDFNGIKNRASLCPLRVAGPPEAIACLWDAGVGHSTGSGFGAVQ